ncbi:MAG: hypothetical protein E7339_06365 [Clostridiales bacterium]|nr:hypothetical protein [Clostridiales bacterium]
MKKKILIIVLSVLLASATGVGIAALCGAFNSADNSSQSSSSLSQNSSEQSSLEDEGSLEIVERVDVEATLSNNVEAVTLKDVYMLCDGDAYLIGDIFNGVTVGDLALYALGSTLNFNYYDDGNWYSADKDGNLTAFNLVLKAIFEYQIGSGEPLALSADELEMIGDTRLITYFESQFGVEIDSIIDNPPAELESLLPSGITSFVKRCIAITVKDLYDITNGDYTYFKEFIENTDVDEITNLLFDLLEFDSSKSYVKLRAVITNLLNGKLTEITVDESVTVYSIVDAYFANTTEFTDFEWELKNQLSNIYGNKTTVGQFKEVTLALDIDSVINNISALAKTLVNEEEIQNIDDVATQLKEVLSGTLGDIKLEISGTKIKELLTEALGITVNGEEGNAFITDLSNAVAQLLNGSLDLIDTFLTNNENLTLADIDGYLDGAISKFVTDSGYDWAQISSLKIADIKALIEDIKNDSSNGDISTDIENANGNVAEIVAVITDFINEWLDENQEISLKELLNDYITIEGELADLKVGELLDKKLFSLDDLILNGALNELMNGTGVEDLLTTLTVNDLYSILTLSASQDALDALDEINLSEVFALIEKINAQAGVEQVK